MGLKNLNKKVDKEISGPLSSAELMILIYGGGQRAILPVLLQMNSEFTVHVQRKLSFDKEGAR